MQYEPVIGLEIHAQLKTRSKMFTRAPYAYGAEPNSFTDPVVLALPGTLPVINIDAILKTVKLGLSFDCAIPEECKWDRKHYCYPDLPKGYQISQYDKPLCKGGLVEIELTGPARNIMGAHRKVQLNRIHLEEDVGKLTHCDDSSLIDFNRAGVPLIEIVTEPDLFSVEDVFAFLKSLRMHMLYAEISDCDMEKGQMRCDANISVRPVGSKTLGTKVELKNLNSISGVCNGVTHEIKRQIDILNSGGSIGQETRRWDAQKSTSFSMRSKEDAHDYRYFPDPDLMPVRLSREMKDAVRQSLPELPFAKQERFFQQYQLPFTITSVLCPDKTLSDFFEEAVKIHNNPKAIANLLTNDFLRELGSRSWQEAVKVQPQQLAKLVQLVDNQTISKQTAQDVFIEMFQSGSDPDVIIKSKGLAQVVNDQHLEVLCAQAIEDNPKAVQEYRSGKLTALNALKGPIMKATQGTANPQTIDATLRRLL